MEEMYPREEGSQCSFTVKRMEFQILESDNLVWILIQGMSFTEVLN